MSAQPSNAQPRAKVGHLTEVHRTVAQIALEDKQLKYVTRDKCFLYGLCLGKVELWHVLSIGESETSDTSQVLHALHSCVNS